MNYYDEIKNELLNNEINKKVKNYSINRSDLNTYYNVGKMLHEAGKHYGGKIIRNYAFKLKMELNKKYNERTLRRYRQFYNFVNELKWSAMPTKLSWSHVTELMVLNDKDEISYYINLVNDKNISYRQLGNLIKMNYYGRIDETTKYKIMNKEALKVNDLVPDPMLIKDSHTYDVFSERVLQKLILEDISSFLKELGSGYTFVDNEYKLKIGDSYNYIDILLYNVKFRCYVVVELKVTKLKKEHIGQIMTYMNYIDNNVKSLEDNKTEGIIICKEDNKYIIKYCSDDRIISRTYELI